MDGRETREMLTGVSSGDPAVVEEDLVGLEAPSPRASLFERVIGQGVFVYR